MAGLVSYASSDEEDVNTEPIDIAKKKSQDFPLPAPRPIAPSAPLPGPSQGPTFPSTNDASDSNPPSRPQSPHTQYRSVIQNLTLPTVPNFTIPDSPPGSPPPGIDAKLQQFLKLKKQGIHFNAKLAASTALKNPNLLGKLIASAGLSEEQQYANTLPSEVWSVDMFEEWMYKEGLEAARREAEKRRAAERRERPRDGVDFVKAGRK